METPDSIAAEGVPDPERPVLKGGGRQVVKSGSIDTAFADFDRLAPKDIRRKLKGEEKLEVARVGTLADGRTVIARPFNEPTLEIQSGGTPSFKIRYRA